MKIDLDISTDYHERRVSVAELGPVGDVQIKIGQDFIMLISGEQAKGLLKELLANLDTP